MCGHGAYPLCGLGFLGVAESAEEGQGRQPVMVEQADDHDDHEGHHQQDNYYLNKLQFSCRHRVMEQNTRRTLDGKDINSNFIAAMLQIIISTRDSVMRSVSFTSSNTVCTLLLFLHINQLLSILLLDTNTPTDL